MIRRRSAAHHVQQAAILLPFPGHIVGANSFLKGGKDERISDIGLRMRGSIKRSAGPWSRKACMVSPASDQSSVSIIPVPRMSSLRPAVSARLPWLGANIATLSSGSVARQKIGVRRQRRGMTGKAQLTGPALVNASAVIPDPGRRKQEGADGTDHAQGETLLQRCLPSGPPGKIPKSPAATNKSPAPELRSSRIVNKDADRQDGGKSDEFVLQVRAPPQNANCERGKTKQNDRRPVPKDGKGGVGNIR